MPEDSAFHLRGRRILVTGGGGSIGGATARLLERFGAAPLELSHRPRAGVAAVDFSHDDELQDAVRSLAPLDGAAICHGAIRPGPTGSVDLAEWRDLLEVNLTSVYAVLAAALPILKPGSSVVVVSSTAGLGRSRNGGPHYTASKWALNGLVKHLAAEYGPSRIRVNAVCPGHIDNEMARSVNTPESLAAGIAMIPMGRGGTPEEVAGAIVYLLSDLASYVTGALLPVAGGTH